MRDVVARAMAGWCSDESVQLAAVKAMRANAKRLRVSRQQLGGLGCALAGQLMRVQATWGKALRDDATLLLRELGLLECAEPKPLQWDPLQASGDASDEDCLEGEEASAEAVSDEGSEDED